MFEELCCACLLDIAAEELQSAWVAGKNCLGEPIIMARWGNGRGAIHLGGGNSYWGEWMDGYLHLYDGSVYSGCGELVQRAE